MILIDTGFFIAVLERRDRLHGRAVVWARRLRERAAVTEFVLWETLNYFAHPASRGHAFALVARVRQQPAYEVVSAAVLFEPALDLYRRRQDKSWSLTDCASFVLMQQRGITRALAHDQHFEQAGFEALLKRDP